MAAGVVAARWIKSRIMTTRQHRPSLLRRLVLPAVTAAFLGYFAFHSFHGEYGMVGRARLDSRAVQLGAQLERLEAERAALEVRVALLRPRGLDQDMVDERARESLSMVHPNDVVLMRSHTAALQTNPNAVNPPL